MKCTALGAEKSITVMVCKYGGYGECLKSDYKGPRMILLGSKR